MRQLPGVESAGLVSVAPLAGDTWIDMIRVPGDTRPFMQLPSEHFRWVTPGYLSNRSPATCRRAFSHSSDEGKRDALVSKFTAHILWPAVDNPIGRTFTRTGEENDPPFTLIGIVADARTVSLAHADPMMPTCPTGIAARAQAL